MKTKLVVGLGIAALITLLVMAACGSNDDENGGGRAVFDDDDDAVGPGDDDDDDDNDLGPPDDDDNDDGSGDDDADDDNEACPGDSAAHTIGYTTWDELPANIKQILVDSFHDAFRAQDFFGRFTYWYGVMRECSRALRDYYDPTYPGTRWSEEVLVAQLAVSYVRKRLETLNEALLHQEVAELYDVMESPVPEFSDPEKYFANHQEEVLASAQAYLWYQIYWAKLAMDDEELPDFVYTLRDHVCASIDTDAEFTGGSPHINFDSPGLAQIVFDTYDDEIGVWKLRFDPKLVLKDKPNIGLVSYE